MSLLLRHPGVATRSCEICRLYVYNEKTGQQEKFRGEPRKRAKRSGPPCSKGDEESKCPKGHYSNPIELSPWNMEAFFHYLGCKATGNFPDDSIVTRNARIIRQIEDSVREQNEQQFREIALQIGVRAK